MINKNLNLHLQLNKLEFNPNNSISQPFTPIDQTLKTPMEAPANPLVPPPLHHQNSYNNQNHQGFYQNPQYNESDDILTDIDEPNNNHQNNIQKKNPYLTSSSNGLKNSSISNLSLSEMNIMNYNQQQQLQTQNGGSQCNSSIRSRSSSINLRKQSLTRNNSNNWLHIGNMNQIRANHNNINNNNNLNNFDFNRSTDSLMDYVPSSIIAKTSAPIQQQHLNSQTPPPLQHQISDSDIPIFTRSRSSTNTNLRNNLSIDTNFRNGCYNNNNNYGNFPNSGFALDSPFLSTITPNDEYFNYNNFQQPQPNQQQQQQLSQPTTPILEQPSMEEINVPNHVSLSEKKRDSLKLKRGIH